MWSYSLTWFRLQTSKQTQTETSDLRFCCSLGAFASFLCTRVTLVCREHQIPHAKRHPCVHTLAFCSRRRAAKFTARCHPRACSTRGWQAADPRNDGGTYRWKRSGELPESTEHGAAAAVWVPFKPPPLPKNKDSSTEQRGGRQTADLSKIMHWAEEQKNGISSFSYDMFRHPELQTSDSKEISPFLCIHLWGVCQHPSLSILLTHTAVS